MKRLADWSIRNKLFLVFLAVVLLPFTIYSVIVLRQSAVDMQAFGSYSAAQSLRQSGQFIASRVDTIKRALDYFTLDTTVRTISNFDPVPYEHDLVKWNTDTSQVKKVLQALAQNNPDIEGFTIYMERGPAAASVSEESREFRPMAPEHGRPWYRRTTTRNRAFWWFPPGDWFLPAKPAVFHALRRIPDDQNLQNIVAWVRADIPVASISDILDKAAFSASTQALVVNSWGEIIARSRLSSPASESQLSEAQLVALANQVLPADSAETGRESWVNLSSGTANWLAGGLDIPASDWRLVLLVPASDIDAFSQRTRFQLLLALAIIAPLMFPLAWAVAYTSTRSLDRLILGLRSVESGQTGVRIPVGNRDELGELAETFNRMAGRIKGLLDGEFASGQAIKSLELKALQAQINPHFLYNSLDLINCLALKEGNRQIVAAVDALSAFYRRSLFGDTDIVPLAEELEHSASYMDIQNMRFGQAVALELAVEPEAMRCRVMKFLLQPLVENALLHGIREKDSESGTIRISASVEPPSLGSPGSGAAGVNGAAGGSGAAGGGPILQIAISDDGVGMDETALERMRQGIQSGSPREGAHGYGVRNIDERLKLLYGPEFGLEYDSRTGLGTTVRIRIPAAFDS